MLTNKETNFITETKTQSKFLHYFSFLLFFMICIMSIFIYIHHDAITHIETNNSKKLKMFEYKINELEKKKEAQLLQSLSANNTSNRADNLTQSGDDEGPAYDFQPSDSRKFLSFDKLIGFKEELTACDGFLDYLKNKSNYEGIGDVEAPLGILMYGCPGTGKTTLARALAKETNLPFFEVSSSIFSQKYKGLAPQMVQDLFAAAREAAGKKTAKKNGTVSHRTIINGKEQIEPNGAIIFLDECETIFADLTSLEAGSEIANVVNQFKTEMTSADNHPSEPIFVIGATNHIEQIDEAIKSRFTYNIEVKPGNKEERKKMLEFLIKKRNNPYCYASEDYLFNVINESLERLPKEQEFLKANRTLENLLKTAVSVFARNRGTGEDKRKVINKDDLKQAYKMIISPNIDVLNQIEKELTSQSK
ncbi:AAA family ATPase [Candidatus Phytoplasma sp. AldY-WA1]|uniref:AAA family ATPase n=1 Tax=Candidatus Phytoplasma sp. AldY-WA1 TaxID=2852100 RepID=UPI00254C99B6|nr:ATP-binding protein [Candidatus Phytoplasma sp. AldY-WA1]